MTYGEPDEAAYASVLSVAFDDGWFVSTQGLVGYGSIWVATLLAAGVAGHWYAGRRPGRAEEVEVPRA